MESQQFIDFIRKPLLLNKELHVGLENIVRDYPYFQSAHLLFAKTLHKTQALTYPKQLRKTAIVANSRSVLYELIHTIEPVITTNKTEEPIVVEIPKLEEVIVKEESVNNTTHTVATNHNEIKITYVSAIPEKIEPISATKIEESIVVNNNNANSEQELAILKDIENETEVPEIDFKTQELNYQIEQEINRGIIQSYVETDIIKTPQLEKEVQNEPVSFTDWLQKVKKESASIQKVESSIGLLTNAQKEAKKDEYVEQKNTENDISAGLVTKNTFNFSQNKQIIDKIIESDPGRIKLGNAKFYTPTLDAKQSLLENEHLVTETLAKIYAIQGNNSKAIRAYEILSLKFPQKSVYFATLIEKLKTKN